MPLHEDSQEHGFNSVIYVTWNFRGASLANEESMLFHVKS
jgi:hypothetical protein